MSKDPAVTPVPDTPSLLGWSTKGFARAPVLKHAPAGGLTVYRCWGGGSSESGNDAKGAHFALEKPSSVIDAELRFHIVWYGNRILYLSTFVLRPGMPYWEGAVWHQSRDLFRPAAQIFVEPPVSAKVILVGPHERVHQDAFVPPVPSAEALAARPQ